MNKAVRHTATLWLTFFVSTSAFTQDYVFPRANYTDSASLATAIPALAKLVGEKGTHSDKELSLGDSFHLALAAEQYDRTISLIDSLRSGFDGDYKQGIYFPFETYAKAKQTKTETASFREHYSEVFTQAYRALNVASQEIVAANSRTSISDMKNVLDNLIEKNQTKDTLTLKQATQLIRIFNFYKVYTQTLPVIQEVVAEEDKRSYVLEKVLIQTKDSSKIQAFVVRKREVEERLPTVFIFNLYADSVLDIARAKHYAAAHYACVVANTRGKGLTEYAVEPFEHDGSDAYDIIDWISRQSWSNGEVGMVGGSYLGFAQWSATKNLHRALKTIMPQVAVGPGIDYPMHGNVFMSYMLRWIHYATSKESTAAAEFRNTTHWDTVFHAWYRTGSSFRSLDTLEGRPSNIFQRWLQHPSFDSYWQNMIPYKSDFSSINIPILTTTGYFDDDQLGAMYYYNQHHKQNPNAAHYLVIGPYTHGGAQLYPSKEVGGYKVDPVATSFNFRNLSIEWFNHILKGESRPALLKDNVNFQVMGTNEWRHIPSLQKMSNDTLFFYFDNKREKEHYKLSAQPNHAYVSQEIDFKDRSDVSKYEFEVIKNSIDLDLLNAVSFISEPFDKPIVISGSFVSSIKASVNKKDFDLYIKVYELMPDGQYFTLFAEGGFSALQRASYARDRSKRQLLRPGEKETIPVDHSYITSKKLSSGSRLVIALGVNKNPRWQINYGTGKDVSDETIADASVPLQIKWHGDSLIKIPTLNDKR